jgi:hypothetical protein
MAGSKDSSDVSPSNIIEPTCETLPAEEQLEFEEHQAFDNGRLIWLRSDLLQLPQGK